MHAIRARPRLDERDGMAESSRESALSAAGSKRQARFDTNNRLAILAGDPSGSVSSAGIIDPQG